jgi:hypothetical protein
MIHHYTTIETLAQILKTQKIRFNRLDRVDDMIESKIYGEYDMSKYIFVSCWTLQQEESIPQWHMYTDKMKGVRISLDKDMFNYKPLIKPKNTPDQDFIIEMGTESPIPFEALWTNDYFILPNITNKNNLERVVEYVENPYDYYKDIVTISKDIHGVSTMNIKEVLKFGMYKGLDWKFQHEFRFALFIQPGCPIPAGGVADKKFIESFPSFLMTSIVNHVAPNISYFDVELSSSAIDNISVTLGPLNSDSDNIIVKALIDKYSKNGTIQPSSLTGKIRKPIR